MSACLSAAPNRREPAGLRFAGYAALFGRADQGGDIILPGAFRVSLAAHRQSGEALPLLWQHRAGERIGWVERCEEDGRGLRVIAALPAGASDRAGFLRRRQVTGLSFGYRARSFRRLALPDGRSGRELAEIDLFEVSLVTEPMQAAARVHFVIP